MVRGRRPARRIVLTAEQRADLDRVARAPTSMQRAALRARIVLACADHDGARAVARAVGVAERTVRRWRQRFEHEGMAGLRDRPRPGHPPSIGPVARLEIIARACDVPAREHGQSGWTLDRLRERVLSDRVVPAISRSTVQRILERGDLKPHRIRGWLHSTDPEFRPKVAEIVDLYLNPPPGSTVLSIDEKTGMQALERRHPDRPARPGQLARREFEYVRHGTQSLIAAFHVHSGRVVAHCGDTRKAEDLERFMDAVAAAHPDGDLHIIWDNLNIHLGERWQRFNERHGGRVHLHYTPLHASWVNQIELFFAIVQARCLRHGSFASTAELRETVLAFIDDWNQRRARPFRWTFTGYPLQSGDDVQEAA